MPNQPFWRGSEGVENQMRSEVSINTRTNKIRDKNAEPIRFRAKMPNQPFYGGLKGVENQTRSETIRPEI